MVLFRVRSRLVSCDELRNNVPSTEIPISHGEGANTTSTPDNASVLPASFSSSSRPRVWPERTVCNMAGLCNEGNTCFFNATIQLLRATPNFTSDLKLLASKIHSAMRKQQQQQQTGNAAACDEVCSDVLPAWRIALELNNLYDEMAKREAEWLNSSQEVPIKPVSPSCLLKLLREVNPDFELNEQQDVHEFWSIIRRNIEKAWNYVNNDCLTPAVCSINNNSNTIQSSTSEATAFQQVHSGLIYPNRSQSQAASESHLKPDSPAKSPPQLYYFGDTLASPQMQPPLLTIANTVTSADCVSQSPGSLDALRATDVAPPLLVVSDAVTSTYKPSLLPTAVALDDLSPSPVTWDSVRSAHLPCKRSFGGSHCYVRRVDRVSPVSALEGQCLHQACSALRIATVLPQNRAGMHGHLFHSFRSEVESYGSHCHAHAMRTGLSPEVADNVKAVKDSVEVLEHNTLDGYKRYRPSFRQTTITSFFQRIKNSTIESTESALESCTQSSSLLHHCLSADISSQEQRPCDFDEPADIGVDTPSSEAVNVSQVLPTLDVVDRFYTGELSVNYRCAECDSVKSRPEVFTEMFVTLSDVVRCIKCCKINIQKAEEIARSKRHRKIEKGSRHRSLPPPIAELPEEQEEINWSCSGDFSCVILKACFNEASYRGDDKYFCENCQRPTDTNRRNHYTKLPPILTVYMGFASDSRSTKGDHLSAPMTLPCLSCFKSDNVDCTDDSHSRYILYGVAVHLGQFINKGHYVCYVKVATKSSDSSSAADCDISSASSKQAEEPSSGDGGGTSARCSETTWVLLDDAQAVVCPRSASSLDELLEATGSGLSATPYLLFYCRAPASSCKSVNGSVQPNLCSDAAGSLYAVDGRLLRPQPSEK